jgi:hypothetical protein
MHRRFPNYGWLLSVATGLLLLGAASGVERALHMVAAGHGHNAQRCAICLNLALVSGTAEVSAAPVIFLGAELPRSLFQLDDQTPTVVHHREPLVARAPPA